MAPTSIDGNEITGATIDGQDVSEITVDGQTVFTAIPEGVVARFKFDQTLNDSAGNTSLTYQSGTVSYTTDNKEGTYAVDVPGDDYMISGHDADSTGWSWVTWIHPNNDTGHIWDNRDSSFNGEGRVILLSGGTLSAKSDNFNGSMDPSGVITQGAWNHIVYQYENGTAEVFVDGVQEAQLTGESDPANGISDIYISEQIGGTSPPPNDPLDAFYDDMMFYDRRLTATEISDLYNSY